MRQGGEAKTAEELPGYSGSQGSGGHASVHVSLMSEPEDSVAPGKAAPREPRRLTLEQGLALALRHHGAGRLKEAERLYRRLLEADPYHAVAWHMLGVIAHQLGKHEFAAELIAKAVAIKPDDADAHANLALALQALGRLDDAVVSYRKALALKPDHAEALFNLGNAQKDLRHFQEAAESYRKVARSGPRSPPRTATSEPCSPSWGGSRRPWPATAGPFVLKPDDAEAHNNLGTALAELGELDAAAVSYRKALALKPEFADAWFNLHTTLYAPADMEPAAHCFEEALRAAPDHMMSRFFLAVLRDYEGHAELAARHFAALPQGSDLAVYACDAWHYIKSVSRGRPRLLGERSEGLALALAATRLDGLVLELGVRFGTSIRQIARRANQEVHGFDSFQGLPEAWHEMPQGAYSTAGELPEVPANVRLHVGLFEDTLSAFLPTHPGPVRFMNVDCDLYSSTATALELLAPRIVPGTVITFDEYLFNPRWREDEFKAFQEAVAKFGWRYDYLAFSLFAKQAVVIMR